MSHMNQEELARTCPEFEAVLEDYISGELDAQEKARVSAHLGACAACSAAVGAAAASRPLLRVMASDAADPGPYFARRVAALIHAEEDRVGSARSFWKPLEMLSLRAAWTSAAAIALLLTLGKLSAPATNQTNAVVVQRADAVGLFSEPTTAPVTRDDVLLAITEGDHGK